MYAQYKSPKLKMLSQQKDKNRKSKKHKNAQRRLKIAQTYSDCMTAVYLPASQSLKALHPLSKV